MGEGRRVPPSRQPPDAAGRPGDAALEAPAAPGEPSPEAAGAATGSASSQVGSAQADSPLPRRVRGTNGARPPAQVERPVSSPDFLERFQAAVAASQQREERAEREEPSVGSGAGGQEAPAADDRPVTHSEQVAAPALLPKRTQGANGAPIPPPQVRSPFSLMGHAVGSGTPEPTTQPIPVITESAAPASPPSVQASRSTDPASPDAADSSQVTEGSEPAGDIPAGAGGMASARPTDTRTPPVTQAPGGDKAVARSVAGRQRAGKRPPSRKGMRASPGKGQGGRKYRISGLLVIMVVLAIAGGVAGWLNYGGGSDRKSIIASADIRPAIRNGAAAWVAGQVAPGDLWHATRSCAGRCRPTGSPAARLRILWPGSGGLAGCALSWSPHPWCRPLWRQARRRLCTGDHCPLRFREPANRDPGGCPARGSGLPLRCRPDLADARRPGASLVAQLRARYSPPSGKNSPPARSIRG